MLAERGVRVVFALGVDLTSAAGKMTMQVIPPSQSWSVTRSLSARRRALRGRRRRGRRSAARRGCPRKLAAPSPSASRRGRPSRHWPASTASTVD